MKPPSGLSADPVAVRGKCWFAKRKSVVQLFCCCRLLCGAEAEDGVARSIYLFLPFSFKTNTNMFLQDGQEWVGEQQTVCRCSHRTFIYSFLPQSLSFILFKFLSAAFWTDTHIHTHRHTLLCGSKVCVGVRSQAKQKDFFFFGQSYISVLILIRDLMPISTPSPTPYGYTHTHTHMHAAYAHTRASGFKLLTLKMSPYDHCYGWYSPPRLSFSTRCLLCNSGLTRPSARMMNWLI